MSRSTRIATVTVALALGLTACGSADKPATQPAAPAAPTTTTQTPPTSAAPVASLPSLSGRDTQVEVASGFLEALTSLKVTPGVLGDATLKNGVLAFPITSGNVDYYTPGSRTPYVEGTVNHKDSGLSLTAGKQKVELTDFVVDPGTSLLTGDVAVNGKPFAEGVNLFDLDGRSLQPLKKADSGKTAELYGTKVLLHADAAGALSQVFKAEVPAGLEVGTARITVNLS